ncbi:MAG: hypothetical protein ACKVT0_03500 [Planctomycetaceae bacterium]
MCWFSALGLTIAGLCSFVDRVSAEDNPPKPLPADLVAAWKKELNMSFDCWMYQDEYGRLKEADRLETPKAGYVPAFHIIADEVREDTLAKLPAPEVPFGIDMSSTNDSKETLPDFLLKEVAGMENLHVLVLYQRKTTEAGLKELAAAKNLQHLSLVENMEVTDAVLKELARIEGLKTLLLQNCRKVTDAGMKEIAKMKNLEVLTIQNAKVTDAGLKNLTGLKSLRMLYTRGKEITPAGITLLEKALPNCKVNP